MSKIRQVSNCEVILLFLNYRLTSTSMILLNVGDFGGYSIESESWDTVFLSDLPKTLRNDRELHSVPINVNLISSLREAQVSTESPSEMPSATVSGSHIPSNEECGIRDVWAHNLEEEFRTIRQVKQPFIITLCHKCTKLTVVILIEHFVN